MSANPDPVDIHVGRRLRLRRMLLKMSQEELAAAVDLTFQQVQKYEKGTNRMGASRLQQFATLLKVPVAYFFEGAPPPALVTADGATVQPAPQGDDAILAAALATPENLQLLRAFARIADPKMRRRIVDLVAGIAGGEPVVTEPARPALVA